MTNHSNTLSMTSHQAVGLRGEAKIPGDKSISHRALILGALAVGETSIGGLLEGEDVLATATAIRMLGAEVEKSTDGNWRVHGVGTGGFTDPPNVVDCGNSGTGVRLLMGAMATTPIVAIFTGDASLRTRPMRRVTAPLAQFGARFASRPGGFLPVCVEGTADPVPIHHTMEFKSAQVKSALLLAGLNAPGRTEIHEPALTRDHTERMLKSFGASMNIVEQKDGRFIELEGYAELMPQRFDVPGDPSSAAFPIAAALMAENSDIELKGICLNSTRCGFLTTIQEMGAQLTISNGKNQGNEPVADIRVCSSSLRGIDVPPERAPSMIDEYPILAALAAFAEGDTAMNGIGELRVKESDRIDAMARGLELCGVRVSETRDSLTVHGCGSDGVAGGAICESRMDHRIAMSFLCLGLIAQKPISVDDAAPIETSFPGFANLMNGLGANLRNAD